MGTDIGDMGEVQYLVGQRQGLHVDKRLMRTNMPSRENPVVELQHTPAEQLPSAQEMANEATRLFVGNEINEREFRDLLARLGLRELPAPTDKLIVRHTQCSNGTFSELSRAL